MCTGKTCLGFLHHLNRSVFGGLQVLKTHGSGEHRPRCRAAYPAGRYILSGFLPLVQQLPELILQATKVERVHADKPSVPKGLTKYLTMLHEELSSHMMKEEQILFPMIKQGMGSQAMGPISVMESEHDEAGELLEVIKHTTNNVTPPPEACTTWKAMYNGINELIDDLMDHISLENNVLFPRALAGE